MTSSNNGLWNFIAVVSLCGLFSLLAGNQATAAGCLFEPQGDGRVAAVIDARTLRMDDGREVRLAGIESITTEKADARAALGALVAGRDVTLHGETDAPDRYGRQTAFVFPAQSDISIQSELLSRGHALRSATVANKDCAAVLAAAEATARLAKSGLWGDAAAIKNGSNPGDILAKIGHFVVVQGKVLSVRQAGATLYINFGRRWTQDFAVTISRRMMPSFEAAGITATSLENQRVRVRGWVERRGGPRIELLRVGQIEMLGDR